MKILLTHAYFLEEDEREKRIMKPYMPLGILYVSAFLAQHGFANEVFDSTFSSFEKQKEKILREKPVVLAIYTNLMTKLNVLRLVQFVRSAHALAHTKILLGGPEVRNHAEAFFHHGVDLIVIGEGEETMLETVQALQEKRSLAEVKGLVGAGI